MSIVLAATAAVLFGVGTYLVLQRKLSRVIIGLGLLTHGANVLMVTAGRRGRAPLVDPANPAAASDLADPLPQALALTAIVISFGVTALLLALAYRSWLLSDDDEIKDIASSNEGPVTPSTPTPATPAPTPGTASGTGSTPGTAPNPAPGGRR